MVYDKDQRRQNLRRRSINARGQIVSEICPEHLHGRPTGYIMYGCHCTSCNNWAKTYRKQRRKIAEFNQKIIDSLSAKTRGNGFYTEAVKVEVNGHKVDVTPLKPVEPEPVEPEVPVIEVADAPVVKMMDELAESIDQLRRGEVVQPHEPAALKAPPVIPAVRSRITSVAMLDQMSKAYFSPDWTAELEEGRERRVYGTMEVIVDPNGDAPIIFFHEREVAQGKPEILVEKKPAKKVTKRVKGESGDRVKITDARSLIEALRASGCTVRRTGSGHLKIGKAGRYVTVPSTASDHRSIPNALSDARKQGLL